MNGQEIQSLRHPRKVKNAGDALAPPAVHPALNDRAAGIGVDEGVGRGRDAAMFGGPVRDHAKDDDVARVDLAGLFFDEIAARSGKQRFVFLSLFLSFSREGALGPVRRVGWRQFRLRPIKITPDSTNKTETVAARALRARLMHIRRRLRI